MNVWLARTESVDMVLPFNLQIKLIVLRLSPFLALEVLLNVTFNGVHPVSGLIVKLACGLGYTVSTRVLLSTQPCAVRVDLSFTV